MSRSTQIDPQLLIHAYCRGFFPMAQSGRGPIDWYSPDPRAILPLDAFHVPRSLRKRLARDRYKITRDQAFERVLTACAEPRPKATETWISQAIINATTKLHRMGLAHSVEAWAQSTGSGQDHQDDLGSDVKREQEGAVPGARLVGGLYGVSIGGAFFGESMFSTATDASKVCLVHLVEHLNVRGFTLLDVQFTNPHLEQFGIRQIPRSAYLQLLQGAISAPVQW